MSIGRSAQDLIIKQVEDVGSNLVAVLPGASEEDEPPAAALGIIEKTLDYDDFKALKSRGGLAGISAGAAYVNGNEVVSGSGVSKNLNITGTTADYPEVEETEMKKGRFILPAEEEDLSRVVVLGSGVAKDFFGQKDPLNKKIKIKKQNYKIVGVLEERGAAAFGVSNQDNSVFVPLKTAQKMILGRDYLNFIRLKARGPEWVSDVKNQTEDILMSRHNIKKEEKKDFSVRDQAAALEVVEDITDVVRYFLLTVGSVALVVGGVGIMNIMLISINQRIKEVGLRKAVGARNSDVLIQFLLEAATISTIGGLAGILLGVLFSFLTALVVQIFGYDWPFIVSIWSILTAVGISFLTGIVFGMYPAKKASKISPMEALRCE
jgi:putative ABC transport system permease protein